MNGHASFNEVFFTDARVPRANILEAPGDGWQIAMTTLAYERRSFDRPRNPQANLHRRRPSISNTNKSWTSLTNLTSGIHNAQAG